MSDMIQIERTEWIDLRIEASRRVTLHKRSMEREAQLRDQLREEKQENRRLRAEIEEKDRVIQRLSARNEWPPKAGFRAEH